MRLLIHVEGQTEEEFVNEVLAHDLYGKGFTSVTARICGSARSRKRRGGICGWPTFREEVAKHLLSDTSAFATSFVDYYALPSSGAGGWPGRNTCAGLSLSDKAAHISAALSVDFQTHYGEATAKRFIPFVAMHEFEGLLFSDPALMAKGIGRPDLEGQLMGIRAGFESPEHINDSPLTAPSKRIVYLEPAYNKILHGNLAALEVTLDRIRHECQTFNGWLSSLENLVA